MDQFWPAFSFPERRPDPSYTVYGMAPDHSRYSKARSTKAGRHASA